MSSPLAARSTWTTTTTSLIEVGENLTLANALGVQLRLVEKALVRMDEGTFGTCEVCTEPIETERLNILPMTNHCIAHA